MSSHAERMGQLGRIALPPLTQEQKEKLAGTLAARLPPNANKAIRKKWQSDVARFQAEMENGAGLTMDQEIRRELFTVNDRVKDHGLHALPASFNVFEAYFQYDNLFHLRPERDHLFSFSDFVDFVTSADASSDVGLAGRLLPEGTIFSFNSLDDPNDVTFSSVTGDQYGLAGASLIRHGDEVSVVLVAGKHCDLEEETARLKDEARDGSAYPGREGIKPHPQLQREAAALSKTGNLQKLLVLTRFDLRTKTTQVRYILTDCGDSYTILTDDPVSMPVEGGPELLAEMVDQLEQQAVLFELTKSMLLLPSYFAFKITLVRDEERLTENGERTRKSPTRLHDIKNLTPAQRVIYRRVAALQIVNAGDASLRTFSAPRFQVEVNGYWRRLGPNERGHGPNGEGVVGRTWVKAHLRWREKPPKPIEVLVKSRVATARAIAGAKATSAPPPAGDHGAPATS